MLVYPDLVDVNGITIKAMNLTGENRTNIRLFEDPFLFRGIRNGVWNFIYYHMPIGEPKQANGKTCIRIAQQGDRNTNNYCIK